MQPSDNNPNSKTVQRDDGVGFNVVARRLSYLRAEVQAKIEYLVDGLLPKGALSLLVAKPKVGKSTLVRCLCAAISSWYCTHWMGRRILTGDVLHVVLEESGRTVIRHYDQIEQVSGMNDDAIAVVIDPAPSWQPDPVRNLAALMSLHKYALVVIDPLFRFTPVEDGNGYGIVSEQMQDLIDLAHSSDTHIMVLHHANKTSGGDRGDEVLGSTALAGSVDVIMSMRMSSNGQRSLYAYGRDIEDFPEVVLHMDENRWITPGETKAAEKAKARDEEIDEAILNWLQPHGEFWQMLKQIMPGVGMNRQAVLRGLARLTQRKEIQRREVGRRYEYRIC